MRCESINLVENKDVILSEIFTKYSNEKKAKNAFKKLRDEQGVVCKKCQCSDHYWKADKWQYECKKCRFRTTLRSGTLLESSKIPFRHWMIALALATATKKSFSALEVQRQLGHKRYEPIWLMMHKIRVMMGRRDDKYKLSGYIEIDEGFFESQKEKGDRTKVERQVKVLVAAESRPADKKPGNKHKPEKVVRFIKMKVIESVTKDAVNYEVQTLLILLLKL
jgi:Zn finger protein HypA/HybF involved in hydrogenase expression